MRKQWHMIGRGFAGWHAEGINISGSGGTLDSYAAEAFPCALVYDASEAGNEFVRFVVSGPLPDPSLRSMEVLPFSFTPRSEAATVEWDGGEVKAFDHVGVGVFEALLRRVPGVRFGRVVAGAVVWDRAEACKSCGADGHRCAEWCAS